MGRIKTIHRCIKAIPCLSIRFAPPSLPHSFHLIRQLRSSTSCSHEDMDRVREARLLRLRSKYLESDSSPQQEPSFYCGFSQSSQDLSVSVTLDTNALLVFLL